MTKYVSAPITNVMRNVTGSPLRGFRVRSLMLSLSEVKATGTGGDTPRAHFMRPGAVPGRRSCRPLLRQAERQPQFGPPLLRSVALGAGQHVQLAFEQL